MAQNRQKYTYQILYDYDKKGRLIRTYQDTTNEDDICCEDDYYIYDEQGNLIDTVSNTLKNNVINCMANYRMVNDYLDIESGEVTYFLNNLLEPDELPQASYNSFYAI